MILKCCIIDDEPLAIELLESYVKKTPFLQLEASFTSAVQAIERISKGDIDLIFLDGIYILNYTTIFTVIKPRLNI